MTWFCFREVGGWDGMIAGLDAMFNSGEIRQSPDDVLSLIKPADDPQMPANDYIVDFDHPTHGPTKMVGVPVTLSETPGGVRAPAPELGQHTEEVLIDVLGWDWDRITELRKAEAI